MGAPPTHGLSKHPLFPTWRLMMRRCYDPECKDFPYYGARGIRVCRRWLDPRNFVADMHPRPDGMRLDRINNNGNYNKRNCRWATMAEQNRNTRRNIRIDGYTASEISRQLGGSEKLVVNRIHRYGWDVVRAISTPARPRRQVVAE